jgi:hypothetical protein
MRGAGRRISVWSVRSADVFVNNRPWRVQGGGDAE